MRSISFYIEKSKEDKKGFVPIKAQVTIKYKDYRVQIAKVKPRYWNSSKQRVIKNREHEPDNGYLEINEHIESISKNANRFDRFDNYPEPPLKEEVQALLLKTEVSKISFNLAYDEFIESNRNKVAYNTTRNRITARTFIKDFQKYYKITLQFEDITKDLFDWFYNYAFEIRGIVETDKEEMENNTFASYIAKFKSFLVWAAKKEYYHGIEHQKYSFTEKEKNVICLSPEEFKTLYSFTFENKTLDKARDLYCFGCLTGLRFSDIQTLRYEHFQNGYILKKIIKTKEESKIPLLPQAQFIIEKYRGDSIYPLPRLSNQKLNDYIKDCGQLVGINTPTIKLSYKGNKIIETVYPKYKLLTVHTARKTFITIGFMGGIDTKIIKAITGHKKDSTFDKYLKIADEMKKEALEKAWDF